MSDRERNQKIEDLSREELIELVNRMRVDMLNASNQINAMNDRKLEVYVGYLMRIVENRSSYSETMVSKAMKELDSLLFGKGEG